MTDVQDTGPLDWRIAIVDQAGRPTPEFQRRWATQRNNNSLIGAGVTLGTGAPSGSPADGAEYIDTSSTPYTFYLGFNGSWHQVSAKFFTDLADVPTSYSGQALKLVRVNSGETALEFQTATANPSATASDTAVNGTATTFMRSDAAPAVQKASATQFGLVKVDGTTITASGGVISSAGGGGSSFGYEASPTVPTTGQFTLTNGGTAVLSSVANGVKLVDTSTSSTNFRFLEDNAGPHTTPYTVKMRCTVTLPLGTSGSYPGLIILANSSSKLIIFGRFQESLVCQRCNSFTATTSNITGPTVLTGGIGARWFAISNDGTNLGFWMSEDGVSWGEITTEPLSGFITAVSQVGVGVMVNGSPVGAGFQSYQQIAGATP